MLVFWLVVCYRFNTLGGALGGFDNDHFLQLALAKQVEAGEQPLRDFLDAVQGARPALTYELSALAQRVLGDNLRSEAMLTVAGVGGGGAGHVRGRHLRGAVARGAGHRRCSPRCSRRSCTAIRRCWCSRWSAS